MAYAAEDEPRTSAKVRARYCVIALTAISIALLLLAGPAVSGTDGTASEADAPLPDRGRLDLSRVARDVADPETLQDFADVLDPAEEINWKVYVPDSYNPEKPAGLLVYVSPTPRGWMPRGWQPVFDERNLIWISADNSGNKSPTKKRMLFAVLAPHVIADQYRIDPARVYLSGFSGGGKTAAMIAGHFSNLFKGAIYVGGAEFWRDLSPAQLAAVKENRFVFLAGETDFNLDLTRKIYRRYGRAGVKHTKLIIVRRMGHATPGTDDFRTAVKFLDGDESVAMKQQLAN